MLKIKIVEFEKYCDKCANYKEKETEEPCDSCLTHPVNIDSHKPINFKDRS